MSGGTHRAVVIGGSAGSLEALFVILPALPADFPLPIFVVVHLPPDKVSVLAELLQSKCAMHVGEARDKEPIEGGKIYFAPPDYHLLVETSGVVSLSCDDPQLYSRPSIDVLFESAADAYERRVIGIVLSGANRDGAEGLRSIAALGGRTVVQSPDQAYSSAMPEAALAACPQALAFTPEQIADWLKAEGAK